MNGNIMTFIGDPGELLEKITGYVENGKNTLFCDLPKNKRYICNKLIGVRREIPIATMDGLMDLYREGALDDCLCSYRHGGVIVEDVFDSSKKYSSEETMEVYNVLRLASELYGISFYMFCNPAEAELKKRVTDSSHPFCGWLELGDLSGA